MKNFIKWFITLTTLFIMVACDSENGIMIDLNESYNYKSKILENYSNENLIINDKLGKIFHTFPNAGTRSDFTSNGKEIVNYIINLPKDEVNRVYNENILEYKKDRIEYDDDIIYEALVTISSEEDALSFYKFIAKYKECHCNNLELLTSYCQDRNELI